MFCACLVIWVGVRYCKTKKNFPFYRYRNQNFTADVKACMGWSEEEEPVFVLEDGTVLIYSMFGIFKTSFSMGQEAKDIKILGARYNSYSFLIGIEK
jgi:hypothetical protein